MFGDIGHPWVVLSYELTDDPVRFAFIYKKEISHFLRIFPILEDYVDMRDLETVGMLELMGFKIDRAALNCGEFIRAWRA